MVATGSTRPQAVGVTDGFGETVFIAIKVWEPLNGAVIFRSSLGSRSLDWPSSLDLPNLVDAVKLPVGENDGVAVKLAVPLNSLVWIKRAVACILTVWLICLD
jgi:hypothetical protein